MSIWVIFMIIGVILISMTLHEAVHAFVGYFLGDDTAKAQGRLTLNPLKHIDPVMTIALPVFLAIIGSPIFGGAKPVPFNPNRVRYGEWGVALVALAGPLTNLFIAFLAFGFGVLTGIISAEGVEVSLAGRIIFTAVGVNLGFFVFNMLPIPPLDGSRALYALAPEGARRVMEQIERYGIFFIFAIVIEASSMRLVGSSIIGKMMFTAIQAILGLFQAIFLI